MFVVRVCASFLSGTCYHWCKDYENVRERQSPLPIGICSTLHFEPKPILELFYVQRKPTVTGVAYIFISWHYMVYNKYYQSCYAALTCCLVLWIGLENQLNMLFSFIGMRQKKNQQQTAKQKIQVTQIQLFAICKERFSFYQLTFKL